MGPQPSLHGTLTGLLLLHHLLASALSKLDLIVALAAGQRDAAGGGPRARGAAAGLVLQLVDGLQDALVPRLRQGRGRRWYGVREGGGVAIRL